LRPILARGNNRHAAGVQGHQVICGLAPYFSIRPGRCDGDPGKRHWKTEVVVASLEMLSGRSKKEYAKEVQSAAEAPDSEPGANGADAQSDLEAVVAK
jgi:hypothetical protein